MSLSKRSRFVAPGRWLTIKSGKECLGISYCTFLFLLVPHQSLPPRSETVDSAMTSQDGRLCDGLQLHLIKYTQREICVNQCYLLHPCSNSYFPVLFIFPAPQLHRLFIVQDVAIQWITVQCSTHPVGYISKLRK